MTIELHFWPTPNGQKIAIALEEMGLPYRVVPVDILKGDQFKPEFLRISPNNRMPAITDPDGPGGKALSLFESGAILIYLAEKTGKFRPSDGAEWATHLQWLMWQVGGVGPMFGQAGHFMHYAPEKIPYGIQRYAKEVARLLRVADKRLGEAAFFGGAAYGIADMALFPWVRSHDRYGTVPSEYPNVERWVAQIDARPAVARGLAVMGEKVPPGPRQFSPEERAVLFGSAQHTPR